ncbi:hypothetical protein lerEdw1_010595 [Lerista edwardsae]|nr:hypothetical protein lerEdw1_010595 [Lerista edwardsae]
MCSWFWVLAEMVGLLGTKQQLLAEFVCLCLLCWGVRVSWCDAGASWKTSLLSCDTASLQFLLKPTPMASLSEVRFLDPEGKPYPLQNNTVCGTSVTINQDNSVAVKVALDGCLIEAQDGNYQLTIRIEGVGVGGQAIFYKQALKCPEPSLALDSPTPSLCSAIPASARLPCVAHQVSQGDCESLGCCYDFRDRMVPCYYGSKVTARCSPDGQFFIAISRNATLPPLSLETVHLQNNQGGRCTAVARTNMFILFQFPLSACGTTFKESQSQWVYENELVADRQVISSSSGSITRDSTFRLTIRCRFSAEDSLPVGIQVATLPPPGAVAQQGPLTLEMRIAREEQYTSYYADSDYPVLKVLRDPVPVEVRILGRQDPVLVLVLHNCWATPSTNPMWKPEWPLLENGCPYKGDNYQTQLVPVEVDSGLEFPSHYQRFIVRTFTFVDGASQRKLTGPVYFHCSASACVPSAQDSCRIRCDVGPQGRRQRAVEDKPLMEPLTLVTSDGPVDFSGQVTKKPGYEGIGERFILGNKGGKLMPK